TQTGQAQILILEISNIFLWLKSSPSLNLNKIEHSAKVSESEYILNHKEKDVKLFAWLAEIK
ncbi:MAG: hypothetical protein J7J07_09045, partial [Syntrophobacterales bacterium]|nr:hypothetical protein [Syntrophobacterales bacterium]